MARTLRHITFMTDAPHFGGAERYIVDMARCANRQGIASTIYWQPIPGARADVFDAAADEGIAVHTPSNAKRGGPVNRVRAFRAYLGLADTDALIINAAGRPGWWLMPMLARLHDLPCVWVHQMVDGRDPRRLPPRWLGGRVEGLASWRIPQALRHRVAAEAASAVITLNREDRARIVRQHGVPPDRIRVVPHGVDGTRFRFDVDGRTRLRAEWGLAEGADNAPIVVGTAGRLVKGKGIELLIDAASILAGRAAPIHLVIAGDGDDRAVMEQRVADHGLHAKVTFAGFVADMPAFYSAVDVFALCSVTESFGLALAEAMACERPVVGTPTAGASRQITHERSGLQLRRFDADELANALGRLAHDAIARAAMGRCGRADVLDHFSIELTLERTLRALRGACSSRSRLTWPGMNEATRLAMTAEDAA